MTRSSEVERTTVLERGRAERNYWADLRSYSELFQILAWRDVAVQYKQSVIGVAWAFMRPLLTMVIFTLIFGRLAHMPPSGRAPYPVMVMAGMLPWFLFSTILGRGSESLVANSNLISKVYFPRLIVPLATTLVSLVDFSIGLLILIPMMLYFACFPSWQILLLPAFVIFAVLASIGPTLILCALNVRYRDVRFIIPFVLQFGLYISPVGFSSAVVPDRWRLWYALNPIVGVIDGFRWALFGEVPKYFASEFAITLFSICLFMLLGIKIFRATERSFADLL